MVELNIVMVLAVACMLIAAAFMWKGGVEKRRRATGLQRLEASLARVESDGGYIPPAAQDGWSPRLIEMRLQRAGFTPSNRFYGLLALPALVFAVAGAALFGVEGAAIGLLLVYPASLAGFLSWRTEIFHGKVAAQLPGFLDSVVRILRVGSSLELAFRNASDECEDPLREIFSLMLLRTQAGVSLEDAMIQVSDTYAVKELSFMAAVFYLGVRYGGNAQVVLERIALSMRERERSQKELRAMTSETRASAWILSILPLAVGLLTLSNNPEYLLGMWADEFGRQLLLVTGGLQVIGVILLFRMARM